MDIWALKHTCTLPPDTHTLHHTPQAEKKKEKKSESDCTNQSLHVATFVYTACCVSSEEAIF